MASEHMIRRASRAVPEAMRNFEGAGAVTQHAHLSGMLRNIWFSKVSCCVCWGRTQCRRARPRKCRAGGASPRGEHDLGSARARAAAHLRSEKFILTTDLRAPLVLANTNEFKGFLLADVPKCTLRGHNSVNPLTCSFLFPAMIRMIRSVREGSERKIETTTG